MAKQNLIIVHRGPEYERDFDEIALKVNGLNRDITVYHLPCSLDAELPLSAWQYPTLTVALVSRFKLPVRRGPVLRNRPIEKLAQQEIFRRSGLPTPPALPFRFGMRLDPIVFGDFVILKPMDLRMTSKGLGIQVFRRQKLESVTEAYFPPSHPIRWSAKGYIVQRFVHTGPYPLNYRATTFLGDVLTLEKFEGKSATPPLTSPDDEIERADFTTKNDRKFSFADEADVMDMARNVARAFAGVPLLGVDIIKDMQGRMYVVEVNAGGNTWHYSSRMWEADRVAHPEYYEEMKTQFGAFDIAARRLCEVVSGQAA